ncbi:MAG: hypothetical protein A2Z20_06470, partial [Bdellovibrionales bacterium RBG_16_40_8]
MIKLLNNRFFTGLLAVILLQQLIVVSSTIWIARLSESIVTGGNTFFWFILFCLSLVVAYIRSTASGYFRSNSVYTTFANYIAQFEKKYFGWTRQRTSPDLKANVQPYINSEAWLVTNEAVFFVSDWFAILLSVIFNVLALGLVIDNKLVVAYLITVPIVTIVLFLARGAVEAKAKIAQRDRTAMMQTLSASWDSVLIGNTWNLNLWNKKFDRLQKQSRESAWHSIFTVEMITSFAMVLTLLPVLCTLGWLISKNSSSAAQLAIIVATLPRQIQTLQNLSDIVAYGARWPNLRTKIQGLLSALSQEPKAAGVIRWADLVFSRDGVEINIRNESDCLELIKKGGRFTLRGPNGSGKSTLLCLLKERLQ